MSAWQLIQVLLLVLFSAALGIGTGLIVVLIRRARARRSPEGSAQDGQPPPFNVHSLFGRPDCWLAIKSRSVLAVQSALGLHNVKPCTWTDGLAGEAGLFVSPPVKGWILVIGSGLPEPGDDVDKCFRFVTHLSRRLGQVQFFCASRIVQHHAWVKAEAGRIVRAYAWAGTTLWRQGKTTAAERELGLRCFDYDEVPDRFSFNQPDAISVNTDKVPMLAAKWSIDPGRLDESSLHTERGVAGEPSRLF